MPARVVRFFASGPVVNLELNHEGRDGEFTVQLTRDQFRDLNPATGDTVYVELRNVRVFPEDYAI